MKITIKKLTPDLAEDYVHFFDETPHWDNVDEHKCYCVCWASTDHNTEIKEDGGTVKGRRKIAKRYVKEGFIQGYLAYYNEKIVGWCNANTKANCLHSYSWEHFMQSVDTNGSEPSVKIKSVFCFVIAPDMQRRGIATKLLEQVCFDAAKDGFDFVEAYPKKSFVSVAEDFMGPAEMYKKCGFTLYTEREGQVIVRKTLK